MHGEIWRLLSWSVIEPSPLSLIFACLLLFWFGRDLADAWGPRRFLTVYLGVAIAGALGTCLVALLDEPVLTHHHVGSWPLAEAVTVAWGLWFPDRVIRIYFIIPVRGIVLAWGTVALTVVYAVYAGWTHYVPNLLAEAAMLAWLYRAPVTSRAASWRRERDAASRKRRAQAQATQRIATVHALRKLEERDEDLAPLSPELEGKLESLISEGAKNRPKPGSGKPS
jgi:hypothetical protein